MAEALADQRVGPAKEACPTLLCQRRLPRPTFPPRFCPWPFADTQRHRWTLFPLLLI